jgi:hypothetical protein
MTATRDELTTLNSFITVKRHEAALALEAETIERHLAE